MKRAIYTSVALSAFAVSFVFNAHAAYSQPSWFDAGIESYDSWPSDGSPTNIVNQGTWSGTVNATLDTESPTKALVVNAAGDSKLTFEVDTKVNAETTNATYNATMTFPNVSTAVSELSDPGTEIKAGLAVAKRGDGMVYCGRAQDPVGETNIWVVLEGATPVANDETSVTVKLKTEDGSLKVRYSVESDNEVLTYNDEEWLVLASDDFTLNGAKFAGSGYRLSALSGEVSEKEPEEPIVIPTATLTLGDLPPNVTLVSVTTNGVAVSGVEGAYTVYSNATVTVTFAPAEGYVLSGASATVAVNINGDTVLPAASVPTAITPAQAIRINEIMASNPSVDKGGITSEKGIAEMDWVEFYNSASQDINIAGWYLSDSVKKPMKAQIMGSCVVPAGGYAIVWLDKIHVDPTEYESDEAYAALGLSSSGDLIQLADSTGTVVAGQSIDFKTKPQIKGYSYGPVSVQDGSELVPGNGPYVYMKTATPGAANVTEGWGDFTPAVEFSEPHGYKTEAFELTLSCADPEAAIYFTLDGTSPTTDSILYTNAIPISKTTVVRAAVPDPTSVLQFDTSATYIFVHDRARDGRRLPEQRIQEPQDALRHAAGNRERRRPRPPAARLHEFDRDDLARD